MTMKVCSLCRGLQSISYCLLLLAVGRRSLRLRKIQRWMQSLARKLIEEQIQKVTIRVLSCSGEPNILTVGTAG